ncbi:MAG: TIGR00725 family protein [Methanoculleus sp.]|nr:TIGR00725 family protein [Methanoculleus sp.]
MTYPSSGDASVTRRPLVAVIGDARLDEHSEKYRLAEQLGQALITERYRLVTGGLGGVMEAASRGARRSPEHRDGDILAILPGNDPCEANPYADVCIATGLDVARNVIISNSDAVIAIGGGSGTLSEIAMAWAHGRLVIGYRVEGWSGTISDQRIDSRIRYPDIPEDRVYGVSSEEEAIEHLKLIPAYSKRHSGIKWRK